MEPLDRSYTTYHYRYGYTTNGGGGGAVKTAWNTPPHLSKSNISVAQCMPLSTRLKGSKMMSLSGFQTYLQPPLTLTFDFLTPRSTIHAFAPEEDLCQFALKLFHSFSKYSVHKLVTDERTNKPTVTMDGE